MVRERADALGMQTSEVNKEAMKAFEQRAKANRGNQKSLFDQLDLDQIDYDTSGLPKKKEQGLSIDYDPEKELTDDEMASADPAGQEGLIEACKEEVKGIKFPTLQSVFGRMAVLIATGILSAAFIISLDGFIKNEFTELGVLPTVDDIAERQAEYKRLSIEVKSSESFSMPSPAELIDQFQKEMKGEVVAPPPLPKPKRIKGASVTPVNIKQERQQEQARLKKEATATTVEVPVVKEETTTTDLSLPDLD